MVLTPKRTPRRDSRTWQLVGRRRARKPASPGMPLIAFALHVVDAEAPNAADRAREMLVNELVGKSNSLEHLRSMVALHGRDAHLRHDGHDACDNGAVVVGNGHIGVEADDPAFAERTYRVMRQIGENARRRITHERREIVRRDGVARLDDDVGMRAQFCTQQVVVNSRNRQQRRDGNLACGHAVGNHDEVGTGVNSLARFFAQGLDRLCERMRSCMFGVHRSQEVRLEPMSVDAGERFELGTVEERRFEPYEPAVRPRILEQVSMVSHIEQSRRDERLSQRIDRRVGHLSEQLVEVIVEAARVFGKTRQRRVGTHRGKRSRTIARHRDDGFLDVIEEVAVNRLPLMKRNVGVDMRRRHILRPVHQVVERERLGVNPRAVRLFVGKAVFDLVVEQHAPLRGIDEQHLPWSEAACHEHGRRVDVEHAHFARQYQAIVGCDVVTRRTQSVAVDDRAGHDTVRECDGRRAIPCLGEHGLVSIPCPAFVGKVLVVVPRFGQDHRNRPR